MSEEIDIIELLKRIKGMGLMFLDLFSHYDLVNQQIAAHIESQGLSGDNYLIKKLLDIDKNRDKLIEAKGTLKLEEFIIMLEDAIVRMS